MSSSRAFVRVALVALVALVVPVAPSQAQPSIGIVRPADSASLSSAQLGAELFAGNCMTCHGVDGRGVRVPRPGVGDVRGQGPSLRGVGALAPDFYLRTGYMPLGEPAEQPKRHRVLLSEREIRALVAYVDGLRPDGPPIPTPHPERGSLSEGLQAFTQHCAGCHQVVGEGGVVTGARVPPLRNATATQIAEAVRIGPYVMPRFPRSQISDRELDSIVRYVLLTHHPVDRGGWGIGNLGPFPEGIVAWLLAGGLLVGVCVVIGRRVRG
jgi:ubiquinol-cytochrome c reductase cytochrome c subunit